MAPVFLPYKTQRMYVVCSLTQKKAMFMLKLVLIVKVMYFYHEKHSLYNILVISAYI